jgi:hypothetical protein
VVRIPIHFPAETQHLFWVPPHLDGPNALLHHVGIEQKQYWWSPNVCRHAIYIGDLGDSTSLDWSTHRSTVGYEVGIWRGLKPHHCPPEYEHRLAGHIYEALLLDSAPRPKLEFRDGERTQGYSFDIPAALVRPRPFARSVEDVVHRLTPDLKASMIELWQYVRETRDDDRSD